jgi:tape measure domain-containing protein
MDLEKVTAHYGADAAEFHRVTNQVESRFVALTQRIAGAAAGGGIIGGIVGAGAGIAAISAITAIEAPLRLVAAGIRDVISLTSQAVGGAINLSMEWEKSAISFEVMTKSAERGQRLLTNLQQLAIESPYRSSQMVHYGEMLLGYGVPDEDIIPSLARLGDIAGGNVDKFRRLALAFGQVLTAGRFMGQEKRQFAEAGVGLEDFAETAGMSSRQFVDAMGRGEIGADVMVRTINRLTNEGGRFFGLMQRINLETVGGQFDALMERLERFGRFVFAGDKGSGVRGLFERFGVSDIVGDLSTRLDAFDPTEHLDSFEAWARRGLEGLSPLADTFRVLEERTRQWAKAGEEMVPTWETVRRVIEEFNQKQLPEALDWIERQAAAVRELGTEVQKIAAFWNQVGVSIQTAFNNLPAWMKEDNRATNWESNLKAAGYKGTPMEFLGDTARATGMMGAQEEQGAKERLRSLFLSPEWQQHFDAQRQKSDEKFLKNLEYQRNEDANLRRDRLQDELRQRAKVQNLDRWGPTVHPLSAVAGNALLESPLNRFDPLASQASALGGVAMGNAPLTPSPHQWMGALAGGWAARGLLPQGGILPTKDIGVGDALNLTRRESSLIRSLQQNAGLGEYGDFQRRMTDLNSLMQKASSSQAFMGPQPQLTKEQYDQGRFEAYLELEKRFGKAATPQLAPAALAGSSAAQDMINQAMMQPTSAAERAIAVLEAARQAQEGSKKALEQIIPILETLVENSGVVVGEDE